MKDEIIEILKKYGLYQEFGKHYPESYVKKILDDVAQELSSLLKGEGVIYAVMFNPMIHESGYVVISLHWNKKDAEIAMEFHKHEFEKENGVNNCTAWTIYEFNIK